jgi:hypothetical protein
VGSSSTAARPARRTPTWRPTAPGSMTTTSPKAPASLPDTPPPRPWQRGDTPSPLFRTGGRWTATPTSGGSPATTSRPVPRRGDCAPMSGGCGSSRSWSTARRPGLWPRPCTLRSQRPYDAAQDRAAVEIIGWLAEHATTRVGPRGRQVQVPLEQLEAAVVRHYTSRAGDPHRHLHLQVNARVFAKGGWRGLHSVGVVDSIEAINGIGHAAVMFDLGSGRRSLPTATPSTPRQGRSPSWRRTPVRSAPAPCRSVATSRRVLSWRPAGSRCGTP